METCYSACSTATVGATASAFASAVQFFAATQCLITEGPYPEVTNIDFLEFDYVIVGAGSSGSVVASRLSEIKELNVLVIEAGGDPPIEAAIPYFHLNLVQSQYDWGYTTEDDGYTNQARINGSVYWPRGKMIGGCSNINVMVYIQGNDEDYQRWYDKGNIDWSVEEVRRCFKKIENFQDMKLNEDSEIYDHYGHDGLLVINTFNNTYRAETEKILSSWDEIGIETVPDLNVANEFGSGIFRVTASNGVRNSISKAYLEPFKGRNNLKIMNNALVTKILINSKKVAYGVEVEQNNKTITIHAKQEIIISAGSVNTPQLLMLSGIGPKDHLKSKNISTIANLQMVGQNLKDHTFLPMRIYFNDDATETDADLAFQTIQYFYNRSGLLAQPVFFDIYAFFALDENAKYPDFESYVLKYKKNTPDFKTPLTYFYRYKDIVADSIVELNKNYTLYEYYISHLHPYSKGNISLNSNNPKDPPLIYPNYFSDPRDLELTVLGMEELLKVLDTPYFKSVGAFHGRIKWPECDPFDVKSREYLKCLAKNTVSTVFHPMGTCRMGSDATNSVVSSKLKVHGVKNLRVIDASVMPSTVSGNTNGPSAMIGERGVQFIKEDYYKRKTL